MNRIARAALASTALLFGLTGTGCLKNTYMTGRPYGGGVYTQKAQFFLWGLVGEKTVDLNQVCPGGAAWFQNRRTLDDLVVSCFTCGLYQPVTLEVRCAGGQSYLAVPDPEEGVTWFYALDEQDGLQAPDPRPAPTAGGAL
ncbi:Bor family protein [Myxococcota bacterium]|nr:Bor family protein [Myxococcota bacterium]